MDYRKLFYLSLGLWFVLVLFFARMFVFGKTGKTVDGRNAVIVNASERALILGEMRMMLQSVYGIIQGINSNDRDLIVKSALGGGTAHMADLDPGLMAKLPIQFKKQGVGIHKDFDELAEYAKTASNQDIMKSLEHRIGKCIACHAAYQLKAEE